MEKLKQEDNDLVEELLEDGLEINSAEALETLQQISLELVNDSEIVLREIESFTEAVLQGDDAIMESEDEYPFLIQVWCGDMYPESHIEGLESLVEDLSSQMTQISEDSILDLVKQRLHV